MITNSLRSWLLAVSVATLVMFVGPVGAQAKPIKLLPFSQLGWEVDKTTKGNLCTVASGDECQLGKPNSKPTGFEYAESVSVAPNGNLYIVDRGNNRVQEVTPADEFVLMFGKDVNETTGANICTEQEVKTSGVKCKVGENGGGSGAFAEAQSIAVDPSTGDVYVQDLENWRVDEYTGSGQFVLMIGKEVNATKDAILGANETEKNLCTAVSGETCKPGVRDITAGTEHAAFNFSQFRGNDLSVGGSEDLLYVGDEHRVQEFGADGGWRGEISLVGVSSEPESRVVALVLDDSCALHSPVLTESTSPTCKEYDPSYGNLYLAYDIAFEKGVRGEAEDVISEFNTKGEKTADFRLSPREAEGAVRIGGMAVDASGHLAVTEFESRKGGEASFGSLLEATTGRLITEFSVSNRRYSFGLGFSPDGVLYAAAFGDDEIYAYTPLPVAELVTGSALCQASVGVETSATFNCSLAGQANPYDVANTEIWFEWGSTCALGSETARQLLTPVEEPLTVDAVLQGLRPNEKFCDRLAGDDQNVEPPEKLTGEKLAFNTPTVPPVLVGEPTASYIKSSSVVMFGELNPENANTRYWFQYGPCEDLSSCPETSRTHALESGLYGRIDATIEATGLQPETVYHYRLVANDERVVEGKTVGGESHGGTGEFKTGPAPKIDAVTEIPREVTATSAVISGAVDGDGQSATYRFELGVYEGAATHYGVVLSGLSGIGTVLEPESLLLTGLAPGVTYIYRIVAQSGYGVTEGSPMVFTTAGLPTALVAPSSLPQLVTPKIAFPRVGVPTKPRVVLKPKKKKTTKRKKSKGRKSGARFKGRGQNNAARG